MEESRLCSTGVDYASISRHFSALLDEPPVSANEIEKILGEFSEEENTPNETVPTNNEISPQSQQMMVDLDSELKNVNYTYGRSVINVPDDVKKQFVSRICEIEDKKREIKENMDRLITEGQLKPQVYDSQ